MSSNRQNAASQSAKEEIKDWYDDILALQKRGKDDEMSDNQLMDLHNKIYAKANEFRVMPTLKAIAAGNIFLMEGGVGGENKSEQLQVFVAEMGRSGHNDIKKLSKDLSTDPHTKADFDKMFTAEVKKIQASAGGMAAYTQSNPDSALTDHYKKSLSMKESLQRMFGKSDDDILKSREQAAQKQVKQENPSKPLPPTKPPEIPKPSIAANQAPKEKQPIPLAQKKSGQPAPNVRIIKPQVSRVITVAPAKSKPMNAEELLQSRSKNSSQSSISSASKSKPELSASERLLGKSQASPPSSTRSTSSTSNDQQSPTRNQTPRMSR